MTRAPRTNPAAWTEWRVYIQRHPDRRPSELGTFPDRTNAYRVARINSKPGRKIWISEVRFSSMEEIKGE